MSNGSLETCLREYGLKLALINHQFNEHEKKKDADTKALDDARELMDDTIRAVKGVLSMFE